MGIELKHSIVFHIMAIILIILFCFSITPKTFQNDTFYTIKTGEYIMENGITHKDPFSWHENLTYTFPHWAYDVLIYGFYNIGGLQGVYISTIILTAILGILMYYINVRLNKNRIFSFIITLITIYLMEPYICARAQLVTFILFLLTIYFIEKFLETKKIRYVVGLIIIPILIANLHCATFWFYFILYLPYLAEQGIYIISYINVIICGAVIESLKIKISKQGETEKLLQKLDIEEKRYNRLLDKQNKKMQDPYKIKIRYNNNIKWLSIIFIICIFTGLLTPLGSTPYTYLIKTMQGISTKNINEHLPVVLADNYKLLAVFIIYITVIAFTKIKIRISDLFMIGGLALLAIYSKRQASMFYLIGSIILNRYITEIIIQYYGKEGLKKLETISSNYIEMILIAVIVTIISLKPIEDKKNWQYVDELSYPVQASQWIKENLNIKEIKLYNEYNFGSYLIFEGIPVFVDSRCDLYLPEFNKDVHIFSDFLDLSGVNFTDMESTLKGYKFTHFLVPNGGKLKVYLGDRPDKYKKIYPDDNILDCNFSIYERIKEE